jgi:hypothetical protein
VGIDVTAKVLKSAGKEERKTLKTGADGRATFEGLPAGATFQALTIVDGQSLATSEFVVPDQGGARFLLVTESASDKPASAPETPDPHAGMANVKDQAPGPQLAGVRGGSVAPKEGNKPGTLVLYLHDTDGKPIAQQTVQLGRADRTNNGVEFLPAITNDSGMVRYEGLIQDEKTDYAAIFERDGLRVGTDAFVMATKSGMEGTLRMPQRTQDLRVLRISQNSRIMIEPREETISVLQNLLIENTSDKVFDPGQKGIFIPLPVGFSGAERLPGGANLDLLDGQGAILRSLVPPTPSIAFSIQARMGFLLNSKDQSEVEIVQPMPFGMAGGLVMVPGQFPITLHAPGLREKAPERDDSGGTLRIYELDTILPGGALRLTLLGLPTRPKTGKWIAGGLCLLLIAGGIVGIRRARPHSTAKT